MKCSALPRLNLRFHCHSPDLASYLTSPIANSHRHPGTLQVESFAGEIHLCLDHRIEVAPETGHFRRSPERTRGDPRSTEMWGWGKSVKIKESDPRDIEYS